jgi:hypothetical protein
MNEMIERVARAIHEKQTEGWSGEFVSVWTDYVGCARAAIEAMRDPTKAMADRGDDAAATLAITHDSGAVYTWQLMIDVALGKAPT